MKDKKTLSVMFMTVTAIALLAMSISAVNAATFVQVSGTITVNPSPPFSINPAGQSDNTVLHISPTGTWTGSIAGSYSGNARWVGHNVGTADLSRNTHNVITFSSVTVMDKTGELTIMTIGKIDGGSWVIIEGTAELAGLHGQGTYSATGNMFGTVANYEGKLHFDL